MRRALTACLTATACFVSTSAFAKDDIHQVAACLVRADAPRMQAWVDYDGPGLIYKEMADVVRSTHCDNAASVDYWIFRGALAEALVKQVLSDGSNIPDFVVSRRPPMSSWLNGGETTTGA